MLCVVCENKETERLMDAGWGEKKPVCTECLTSGRWKELLPEPTDVDDLSCSVCGRPCKSAFGLKSHMKVHK